ncbi:hypothetical protein GYB59_16345 [bacterium]|nr:hypothetical protein [bacterium]
MTSLISWTGVDNRGPASLYIASDSRLSGSTKSWDCGRKVFACRNSPDIFGYCGAVLFPSQFISQLIDAIDAGVLFPVSATPGQRVSILRQYIDDAAASFPEQSTFKIAYGTRNGEGFGASFLVATISWDTKNVSVTEYDMPRQSDLVLAAGSGTPVVEDFQFEWRTGDVGQTSRAVFSAFCDAIQSGRDKYTGGPPQLVGLYLRGPARTFGVIHNGDCFLHGMRANENTNGNLECHNRLFERCDVHGTPIGQRHARPKQKPA